MPVTKKPVVSILDFGGGVDAALAHAVARILLKKGWTENVKLTLVDYNACVKKASAAHIEVIAYRTLYELRPSQTFDIIIASAIMEHVPNLGNDLLILLNSLALGGAAYFRTPSNSKMMRFLKNFGITLDFTYPAHLHDLGQPFWAKLLPALHLTDSYRLVHSKPAIVETDFRRTPLRTAVAWAMKAPWYVLDSKWAMVGGWEAIIQRLP
jgi:trans-aconitate methyltransferase